MMLYSSTPVTMETRYGSFRFHAFLDVNTGHCHQALLSGPPAATPKLRVQSKCLPGTAFGSVMCDCGDQLQQALRWLGTSPGAILLHLDQEARGHGLFAKVEVLRHLNRNPALADAQHAAGVPEDARNYRAVAAILKALDVHTVDLLSNSEQRTKQMRIDGVPIRKRLDFNAEPIHEAALHGP